MCIFLVERELKVLFGKSLCNLFKLVLEGLMLVVYLNLFDSIIIGFGFDVILNGLSMVDVIYKIFFYWKCMCKDKKDGVVNFLINVLRDMGWEEIVNIVFECYWDNKELFLDVFIFLFIFY